MEDGTIFPALSLGEQMVHRCEDETFFGRLSIVILLTNFRLLIRWKVISCGFFSPSYYSSINLYSIQTIDHTSTSPNWILLLPLMIVFSVGWVMLFTGEILGVRAIQLIVFGVLVIVGSIAVFILVFVIQRRQFIQFKGTFGVTILKLTDSKAREFESRLSELIYQRKAQQSM